METSSQITTTTGVLKNQNWKLVSTWINVRITFYIQIFNIVFNDYYYYYANSNLIPSISKSPLISLY